MASGQVVLTSMVDDPIRAIIHPSHYSGQTQPRQQIGRMAYKCGRALSQYHVVYAHMRKSNTASRKAAERAGFVDATAPEEPRLVLVLSLIHI